MRLAGRIDDLQPKEAYNLAREVLLELLAKRSDIRVIVLGVYPDARALGPALAAHARLKLLGVQPYEKMNSIYHQASVMFYPSFRESTGSALMEGLGHGLPIVGIRVNSRASLPPEVGVLVEPKEPALLVEDLVAGIERVIDDPAASRAMSNAAREFAEAQTWGCHAQTMVQEHYPAALAAHSAGKQNGLDFNVLLVTEPGLDGVFRHLEALAHYLIKEKVRVHLAYSSIREAPRSCAWRNPWRQPAGERWICGSAMLPGFAISRDFSVCAAWPRASARRSSMRIVQKLARWRAPSLRRVWKRAIFTLLTHIIEWMASRAGGGSSFMGSSGGWPGSGRRSMCLTTKRPTRGGFSISRRTGN